MLDLYIINWLIYAIAMYVLYGISLVANIEDQYAKKKLSIIPAISINSLFIFYLL